MEIKRYKNFVLWSKVICLVLAVALISFLLIIPKVIPVQNQVSFIADENQSFKEQEKIKVIGPNVLGYSQTKGPYEISASKIIQKSHELLLEIIKARMIWNNQKTIEITADNAVIGLVDKTTKISGKVNIFQWHNSGKISTEEINIDQNNNINSTYPFSITSLYGDLQGENGFMLLKNQDEAQFFGPLRLNINHPTDGQITISAQKRFVIALNSKRASFEEGVDLQLKQLHITANNATSDYSTNDNKIAFSIVKFTDQVKAIAQDGKTATANQAEYIVSKEKIVLQGNVQLKDGNNLVSADSLIYDTKLQAFVIEGNTKGSDQKVEVIIKHNE